jgi:hypothetical protein
MKKNKTVPTLPCPSRETILQLVKDNDKEFFVAIANRTTNYENTTVLEQDREYGGEDVDHAYEYLYSSIITFKPLNLSVELLGYEYGGDCEPSYDKKHTPALSFVKQVKKRVVVTTWEEVNPEEV